MIQLKDIIPTTSIVSYVFDNHRDKISCMNILAISESCLKSGIRPDRFCRTSTSDYDFSLEKANRGPSVVFTSD